MRCPSCQKMIADRSRYCPFCGEPVNVAPAGPATFNENEDFLSGSVPRYEDSGAVFEEAPGTEDLSSPAPATVPKDTLFTEPVFGSEPTLTPEPAFEAEEAFTAGPAFSPEPSVAPEENDSFEDSITSMYGESYRASDARYSQPAELSGLNLLSPYESGDDASNRRTAMIALGVFGALAAIVLGAAIFLVTRSLGNLTIPSGGSSGNRVWDFLVSPRPSYGGFDEQNDDWLEDNDWTEDWENGEWDDFWGSGEGEDTDPQTGEETAQGFNLDQVPVQTPEMTELTYEDYLAGYAAPTELGEDLYSGIIRFDGDLYRFPVPVSAFTGNGWTVTELEGEETELGAEAPLGGGQYSFISLQRGDKSLRYVTVYNPNQEERPLSDAVMIDLHADLQDGELLELPGLAADADADAAAAFLEEYGFTADRENGYTVYYLCFSPSGSYTSSYSQNWITLYDYDQDDRIDSVTLDYEHPFSR